MLDPQHPSSLMYANTVNGPVLLGAMFLGPAPCQPGPDVGGPLTQWHAHDDLCLSSGQVVGRADPSGQCSTGVHKATTYFMLHVWTAPSIASKYQFQADLPRSVCAQIDQDWTAMTGSRDPGTPPDHRSHDPDRPRPRLAARRSAPAPAQDVRPAFVTGVLEPSVQGQPGFIAWPITQLDHLVAADPVAFNVVFAAVQLLIGIGPLVRSTVKPALVLSVVWSIGVWAAR